MRTIHQLGAVLAGLMVATQGWSAGFDGAADPKAVVVAGRARFTVLTPRLVRMEWSATGAFEDRPSYIFIRRRQPVPKFDVVHGAGGRGTGTPSGEGAADRSWTIRTEALTLKYADDGKPFHAGNLSIEASAGGRTMTWRAGQANAGDLKGTWRTLDGVSGASQLEAGLLSREGWTVVDDSRGIVFESRMSKAERPESKAGDHDQDGDPLADWPWAAARHRPLDRRESDREAERVKESLTPPLSQGEKDRRDADAPIDWYFFAYGNDYVQCLRDFTAVAGEIPLPPRYVFGAWWSRYWAYSDRELRELVAQFRRHEVPLDVLVVDMDWHLDGWTGYTWNPKYFPDPEGFLKWTAEEGLRVPLNLHPAEGVGKHEKAFEAVCKRMGLDPAKTDRVPFDCTDRKYVDAYFAELHHPLERQGVDFWWMDWQQGKETKIPGLDPLPWLNYLHWTDWERNAGAKEERPLIFSRWGGLGNHRYPIGFSGDTFCNWASLAFQPYFTATAGNVCYPFWSHDIGGHMPGPVEPELYVRWIQWGALSPALRTHTAKNPLAERRIWAFPTRYFEAMRAAWRLRYALLPYIYTAARQAHDAALPLCRPIYYAWPEREEAYATKNQYLFGDDLLVAPVIAPAEPSTGLASTEVWLPPGKWTHWFTGRVYEGPGTVEAASGLEQFPLLARDGAMIATTEAGRNTAERPAVALTFNIFGGLRGGTRVYEDDGLSKGYLREECAWTPATFERTAEGLVTVVIGPTEGAFRGMEAERRYAVRLHDVPAPMWVRIDGEMEAIAESAEETGWYYDATSLSLTIRTGAVPVGRACRIETKLHEDAAFESMARAGLREGLAALRRLGAALEGESPRGLTEALDAVRKFDDTPALSADRVTGLRGRTAELLEGLSAGSLARPAVREAAARLLGLRASLRTEGAKEESGSVGIHIRARVDAPLGFKENPEVRARLTPVEGWEVSSRGATRLAMASAGEATASLWLRPGAAPQTATVRGEITVTAEGRTIAFPVERVIFPGIHRWWVFGPYAGDPRRSLVKAYRPEKLLLAEGATPDAAALEKAGGKKVERPYRAGEDAEAEHVVNFQRVFGGGKTNSVAYAFVYLHAPAEAQAVLAMGSDDGCVVWLNGREVHRATDPRAYTSKADRVAITLEKGVNRLLIKVNQGGGGWDLGAHIETPEGRPMAGVRAEWEAGTGDE